MDLLFAFPILHCYVLHVKYILGSRFIDVICVDLRHIVWFWVLLQGRGDLFVDDNAVLTVSIMPLCSSGSVPCHCSFQH